LLPQLRASATPIDTLSLHDALPISAHDGLRPRPGTAGDDRRMLPGGPDAARPLRRARPRLLRQDVRVERPAALRSPQLKGHLRRDRKSTRLNSSHEWISYAVFCLKK